MKIRFTATCLISMLCLSLTAWAGPKEDAALLPSDTQMFIQVDFAGLKQTPIFRDMVANNPMYAQGLAEIKSKTGIDVDRDVKTITMGLLKGNEPDAVVVIIDTPLKVDSPAMKEKDVEKVSFSGKNYYRVGSNKDGAIASINGRTVITQESRIKDILTGKARLAKNLMKLSNGRDQKAQLWIFGTPPDRATGGAPFRPENIYGFLDLKSGMKVHMEADTTKEFAAQAATTFNAEKKKIASTPQLAAMGLSSVVEKIQLSAQGKRIKVSLDLNAAEMNQLTNVIKMMMMAGGAGGATPPMPTVTPNAPKAPIAPPTGTPIKKKAPGTP